ncbi:MAG: ATP-binding cassette domain-containing protein, partial [Boseongicola sp.]|nr:ATP-binding cassette domain-containing protein [Boseongicola sp.]
MSDNPYQDDRGNKDASIANPKGGGSLKSYGKDTEGKPGARDGQPFLIGDAMTGGYGTGADILHDCTISVNEGEIAVIVGPNGAGKSTAMKAVFGMLNVRTGAVRLNGEDITKLTPQARVAKGMAFVPQTSNIFTSMTVEENLEMGAFLRRDDISATMEQVYELFPILRDKRLQPAGELSGGQ